MSDTLDRGDRRAFLLRSAVGATALLTGPRALRAEPAPSDKLSLAVIGCGGIAVHHGRTMPPLFELRALCDVDRARIEPYRAEFAPEATLTDDYRDLLSRDDIDALLICTPDHWHAKIAIEALRSGKDVYCEKPLTLTIDEGRRLRDAVAETGRVLQVGTQQRSDPNFQTAVALANEGRLGRVRRITAAIGAAPVGGPFPATPVPEGLLWDRWLGPAPTVEHRKERCHGNFRWWYEYSGGKMTDWGAHHVDIALWAAMPDEAGDVSIDPVEVVHVPPLREGMPTTDDHYNTAATFRVVCRLANGVELQIRDAAPDLGFDNGILIEGEEGRLFVNRGKLTGKPVEKLAENPLPEGTLPRLRRGRPVEPHFTHFWHACHHRTTPISDVDSHVLHLNVCHAANIAMRLGRPLVWRPGEGAFAEEPLNERWRSRPRRPGYEITG